MLLICSYFVFGVEHWNSKVLQKFILISPAEKTKNKIAKVSFHSCKVLEIGSVFVIQFLQENNQMAKLISNIPKTENKDELKKRVKFDG